MDLQFVFGNPVAGSPEDGKAVERGAKRSTITKGSKTKRTQRSHSMRDHRGRFVKRKKTRRNPLARLYKKGGESKALGHVSKKDLSGIVAERKGAVKRKQGELAKRLKTLETQVRAKLKLDEAEDKKLRKEGWKRATSQYEPLNLGDVAVAIAEGKLASKMAKKNKPKKSPKKSAKKSPKKSPKKTAKKSSKKAPKKTTKKSSKKTKKTVRRRRRPAKLRMITRRQRLRSAAKKTRYRHPSQYKLKLKKGRYRKVRLSVSKVKRNPIGGSMFEQWTGHTVVEAGGLAVGGALYGAANGLLSRIPVVKTAHAALMKVPVVGSALPVLLLGAVLHKVGSKQGIKALEVLGKGVVGASVVGMGVSASQMIPALRPAPVSGVDYTEMSGLGEYGEADFGEIPFDGHGQMGGIPSGLDGVDYTMSGVDFTMSGLGEADFGEGDEADFGEIPAGLGEGQMG